MSDARSTAENNLILEIQSGSNLYGTNTPESDLDYVGIFMPDPEHVYGLNKIEEVDLDVKDKNEKGKNTKDAVDRKRYEFRRFCKLALDNNPNILEILFVNQQNTIFKKDPYASALLEKATIFLHKGLYRGFIGYAHAQKHKMVLKAEHYNVLLEAYDLLCNTEDIRTMGELRHHKIFQEKGRQLKVGDLHIEAGSLVKKARTMVKHRLDAATNRTELITKYGYDVKFGSHLLRLLMEGIELLQTGTLIFPLTYADIILKVKRGKYTAQEVIELADKLEADCTQAYEKSKLPSKPKFEEINSFVINQVRTFLKELP